ncbi:MAG: HAMP domain-containing histidine kinase [Lachnospiraceae bacterium]|nr:HAMP domain-containing histidine kinase [Lachnospiraceae bacterium]
MKRAPFLISIIVSFVLEIILGIIIIGKIGNIEQDTVVINECLKIVAQNYGDTDSYSDKLEYSIIDNDGNFIFSNSDKVSVSVNEAVKNNDTMLDIVTDDGVVGKLVIRNTSEEMINRYKENLKLMLFVFTAVQLVIVLSFFIYLKRTITDPFNKLNSFAVRVAGGNLDIPLERDKKNIFGDFTEAFDIMRSEIKIARAAEKKAYDDKNEMVAQLSHDIKTPVASIKSSSEIGYEVAKDDKSKEMFNQINIKSDQLTTLVDNLFNSSVSDVTEIAVNPFEYSSNIIKEMIVNSDYLFKSDVSELLIPECRIFADKLRLQQVIDNLFMNSYKYAGTDIKLSAEINEDYLVLRIADKGPGVKDNELPLLKYKYKRGSNVEGKDGAGLGLYLTDYFLQNMDGKLALENCNPGFAAIIYLRLI